MPWPFQASSHLAGVKNIQDLVGKLGTHLSRLSRLVVTMEPVTELVYGTTVRGLDGSRPRAALLIAQNATPFTIPNPLNPREGVEILIDYSNNTAGALGAITFGADFEHEGGAFVAPGAGKHRIYKYYRTKAGKWRETSRTADI